MSNLHVPPQRCHPGSAVPSHRNKSLWRLGYLTFNRSLPNLPAREVANITIYHNRNYFSYLQLLTIKLFDPQIAKNN